MINIKKLIPLELLLVLLWSCSLNTTENNTIKLEPTENEKIKLGNVKMLIPLEASKESNLNYIEKTVLDLKNDRIFVQSDFNIFIFDSNGKFINKLKQGRGPGEVSMVPSFSINSESKLFYALDNSNFICIFNYDGKMIRKFEIHGFSSIDIKCIDDENVLLLCNYVGGTETNFVGIYNFEEKKVIQKFISVQESPYPKFIRVMGNSFPFSGNRQFFSYSNIFALFEFKNNNFQKVFNIDLGERTVPNNFLKQFINKKGGKRIFREEAIRNSYVPFLSFSFYFNKYFLIITDDLKNSCYAINEKNWQKVYLNGQISSYFNLPEVQSLSFPSGISNDYLIFSCNPLDFFENDAKVKSKMIEIGGHEINVNYDSNPFLIIVK